MPVEKITPARAEQIERAASETRLLTLNEAAPILGISARTLYEYARNGQIKARKIAGKWRISAAALKEITDGEASISTPPRKVSARERAPFRRAGISEAERAALANEFKKIQAQAQRAAETAGAVETNTGEVMRAGTAETDKEKNLLFNLRRDAKSINSAARLLDTLAARSIDLLTGGAE